MCELPRRFPNGRFLCVCDAVGEFNSERVVRSPQHAAQADATVMAGDSQRELVRDGDRLHTDNFRTTIGKIAHYARAGQLPLIDRRRRIPFDTKVLSALTSHRFGPLLTHVSLLQLEL